MTVVLDASVVAKLLVEEPDSAVARDFVSRCDRVIAPEWIIAEAGNIFWRKVRLGALPRDVAAEDLRRLPGLFARLEPCRSLADQAFALSVRLNHPIYDCFYLALAQREAVPLATADRRLAALATAQGIAVTLIAPP